MCIRVHRGGSPWGPRGSPSLTPLPRVQILRFEPDTDLLVLDDRFVNLVVWNGSKSTRDLQDLSIFLLNVTYDHAGEYLCRVDRNLTFDGYVFNTVINKTIHVTVVDKGECGCCHRHGHRAMLASRAGPMTHMGMRLHSHMHSHTHTCTYPGLYAWTHLQRYIPACTHTYPCLYVHM